MSLSFLDQNFDDDEEEEEEDFNPAPARESDDEGAGSDNEKPSADDRPDADYQKGEHSQATSRSRQKLNGHEPPPSARSNGPVTNKEAEEGDEDDEGEGEDLGRDDEDDEDEEDEDDEEAVSGRPRKRRKRGLNQFFEEEAEVDEDDDELEAEEDDIGADGFVADTHPDDLEQLPAGAERDDRRHRELDAQRDLAASMDAERQAQLLKERYGRRTATALNSNSFVPQNLLMPSVDDPSIWGIRCKQGKEREVIFKIMQKFQERQHSRQPMRICSAFERGSGPMAGYIFVEAKKKADVDDALANIADVYPRTKTNLVPVKEMPDLLRVTKTQALVEGGYVRIKRGLYQGDLAMIQEVESNGLEVTVRLVPRLTYGLDEDESRSPTVANSYGADSKRKRLNAFGAVNNVANRPPPRLFSEAEAKKKHSKFLTKTGGLSGRIYNYRNEQYEDGFLIKDMKLQHLITQDVNPRLDEITKLTRTNVEDGTEALDLESLAHSLRNNTAEGSYIPGDEVEVYQGEQRGITGRTEAVQGNIVSIKVSEGDLQGQTVDVPMKGLRKRFREGDHVKVIGGSRYRDEVGMVIKIKDDRVTVLTDLSMTEVTVFSKDLREATDTGTAIQVNKYDVQELLQLDPATVGIVIKSDRESVRVLDQDGSVSMRLPSQITSTIEPRKNAVATDKNGFEIRIGDVVREAGGEGKTGTILHIHRSFLFLHNKTQVENSGLWTTRCMNVITTAAKGGRITAPSIDMTKMNPALQMKHGGMNGDMPPPRSQGFDRLRGKKISIRRGPYKGNKGIVKDTTDTTARIELEAKNKVVNVDKEHLNVIDQASGKSMDYRSFLGSRGPPRGGGFSQSRVPDGGFGGRTPMLGDSGRTPAWSGAGGRTPGWVGAGGHDSGKTPAWKGPSGSNTSYGGSMTSYGGAGSRTPAWAGSSRTPYDADHGFSSSNTNQSGFDAFASGSRTPAYGASMTSRTPAWQGPNAAPPTPAAAPTPGAFGSEDPYTPAPAATPYNSAPTPSGFGAADAPTPGFAKGSNRDPLKHNRLLDAPTPAVAYNAPTPQNSAPTPGAAPQYMEDSDEGE